MDISYLPTHSKFYRDFDNNNNMEQLMVTTIIIVKLPYHNKTSLLNSDEYIQRNKQPHRITFSIELQPPPTPNQQMSFQICITIFDYPLSHNLIRIYYWTIPNDPGQPRYHVDKVRVHRV